MNDKNDKNTFLTEKAGGLKSEFLTDRFLTDRNGNALPAIIKGSGKPLVFLHGFMSSKEAFLNQINFFSKRFKVYAPDLKGFGENDKMPFPYTLGDYLNDFLFLVSQTNSKKVSVAAHSFGCRVALKALCETDVIERAVLVGAAGLKTKKNARYFFRKAGYKICKPFLPRERLEAKFFSEDYNMLGDVQKSSFKLVTSEKFDEKLFLIKAPVLAVFGENDRETPPYLANRIVKSVPNARKYIMKGCGHFCFLENPAEFNLVLNEFL